MQTEKKIWFMTKEGITGILVAFALILGGVGIGAYAKTWTTGSVVTAADFQALRDRAFGGCTKYRTITLCTSIYSGNRHYCGRYETFNMCIN